MSKGFKIGDIVRRIGAGNDHPFGAYFEIIDISNDYGRNRLQIKCLTGDSITWDDSSYYKKSSKEIAGNYYNQWIEDFLGRVDKLKNAKEKIS